MVIDVGTQFSLKHSGTIVPLYVVVVILLVLMFSVGCSVDVGNCHINM